MGEEPHLSDLVPVYYGNDINDAEKQENIEISYQEYLLLRMDNLERQKRKIRRECICLIFKIVLLLSYCVSFVFVFIVFYMGKDLPENSKCLFDFQCLSHNCDYEAYFNNRCIS